MVLTGSRTEDNIASQPVHKAIFNQIHCDVSEYKLYFIFSWSDIILFRVIFRCKYIDVQNL